jgi:hypothetical protein
VDIWCRLLTPTLPALAASGFGKTDFEGYVYLMTLMHNINSTSKTLVL